MSSMMRSWCQVRRSLSLCHGYDNIMTSHPVCHPKTMFSPPSATSDRKQSLLHTAAYHDSRVPELLCGPLFDLWLIISQATSLRAPHTSEIFKIVTTDIIIISDPLNISIFQNSSNECYRANSLSLIDIDIFLKSLFWPCVTNSIFF